MQAGKKHKQRQVEQKSMCGEEVGKRKRMIVGKYSSGKTKFIITRQVPVAFPLKLLALCKIVLRNNCCKSSFTSAEHSDPAWECDMVQIMDRWF